MKKIIDGKMYDTEKAEWVASSSYGNGWGDFNYESETLYITKNGQWFLSGEGGPLSKYSISVGMNQTSGSEVIELYSEEEAKLFIEENGDTDTYEKYFEVEEG